jgi:predicted RNA-binding Zn ribbon-like protein
MVDFVFLADALALDFVNTEIIDRGKRRDLLQTPQDLQTWWGVAKNHYADLESFNPDGADLDTVKTFRSTLRRLFTAVSAQQKPTDVDLAALNTILQSAKLTLKWHEPNRFSSTYRSDDPFLFTLALDAHGLLTEHDLSRIHPCKNERCILLFYDKSKNGTRRWCSWNCMNRARSIENYRKSKEEKE